MIDSLLSLPSGFYIGDIKITFYGIISALSYLLGVLITAKNAKKRGFTSDDIIILAIYVIPLCVIGARIYYVLFSLDEYTYFWDIFKIWKGGLAFYGGLIGGAIGVILYCAIHKKNFFALIDIIAPSLICAQALGRWGNFFNQEAYGYAVTNPDWQWFPFAVYIDDCRISLCDCSGYGWHLATFFYESLWNFLSFIILMFILYKVDFKKNGIVAGFYFIFYGSGRIWIEGLRTDSLYIGSIRVSQLLSGIFIVVGLAIVIWYFVKHHFKKKEDFDIIMDILKNDLD